MYARTTLAATAAVMLACACGDDGASNPDATPAADAPIQADAAPPDGPLPLTLDDLCATDGGYVAFFERILECYPEQAVLIGDLATPESLSAACYGQYGDYYADGSLDLDRTAWDTCLSYIATVDCNLMTPDGPHPCRDVIAGLVGLGGDCEIDEQCTGDAFCDNSVAAFGVPACGTCTARFAVGQACDAGAQCSSLYCDNASGQCAVLGLVGSVCNNDNQCLGKLLCGGGNLCEAPPAWAVDTPCMNTAADCGFPGGNLYCDEGLGMCRTFLSVGDPCGPTTAECNFVLYETCDTAGSGQCVAPTIVGDGAACSFGDGAKCGPGLVCSNPMSGGTCFAPLAEGDNCSATPSRCGFLLQCNGLTCEYNEYSGMCPIL